MTMEENKGKKIESTLGCMVDAMSQLINVALFTHYDAKSMAQTACMHS